MRRLLHRLRPAGEYSIGIGGGVQSAGGGARQLFSGELELWSCRLSWLNGSLHVSRPPVGHTNAYQWKLARAPMFETAVCRRGQPRPCTPYPGRHWFVPVRHPANNQCHQSHRSVCHQ